uniref:Uncharacterized protein n=1 Tax=Plectus sambesii TaxID=2011161 RepID=A0A914URI1_9BILA
MLRLAGRAETAAYHRSVSRNPGAACLQPHTTKQVYTKQSSRPRRYNSLLQRIPPGSGTIKAIRSAAVLAPSRRLRRRYTPSWFYNAVMDLPLH